MYQDRKIRVAQSDKDLYLLPQMANRHGLIAGATGTGKTITMKVMAESFSDMGVPVFMQDIKGDLSGMCVPGEDSEGMQKRITKFGLEDTFQYKSYPTRFWDVFGKNGVPVRVAISEMGPTLISRLLNLTDVQAGVLNIAFKIADEANLYLDDYKDLRALLQFVGDNRAEFTLAYGNISTASIGAIQRALLAFEQESGVEMFGRPTLDIRDWMRTDSDGRGYINILNSTELVKSPTVYATFLMWMLSDLFEKLPEVGDLDKPRMVFFFDEAHLLFTDMPKALVTKMAQVVRLIRSKGVGVYFVTQSPSDIPDDVLAQLSNKIQHALRAYTPSELKAVRAAAMSYRENPAFKTEEAITELGTGEALVSLLDEKGIPTIVERAFILPPQSLMGAADAGKVNGMILADEFMLKYQDVDDRESAYEMIMEANELVAKEAEEAAAAAAAEKEALAAEKQRLKEEAAAQKAAEKEALAAEKQRLKEEAAAQKAAEKEALAAQKAAEREALKAEKEAQKAAEAKKRVAKQAASNAASTVATAVTRNVINSMTGGKTTSTSTIAKRAATNALTSVARSSTNSIIRGLFGNKR